MQRSTGLWSYVLSIGKLGKGQEGYYLDAVARGTEDYYLGRGESPGRWCGSAATELGLNGEVGDDELRAVLQGEHPASRRRLVRRSRTLPGFDCTFSAPKSVSVVHSLADAEQGGAIAAAHDAAVDAALGYLERQAAIGRRGRDGVHRIETSGFVAAAFRHRTSRAQDPQLHTHVLVANMVKGPDARWGAIFGRLVYAHKMDAGAVYQAHLRAELTERLGVEWHTPRNGLAELQGVPAEVLRAFSQRRTQIEAALAARGESSAAAAATATLATRTAKRDVDAYTLISEWRERAAQLGFGAEQLAAVTGRTAERERWLRPDQAASELTAHASYFDRRHAVRVYASSAAAGLRVDELERRVDRCLADAGVVALEPDPLVGPRYTTRELLRAEESLLDRVDRGRNRGVAVADEDAVDTAVGSRPSLTLEQRRMVQAVTRSGSQVDVVVGAAGAGKTYALDAARAAWHASGHHVVGCALAARAAAQLEAGAGIPSFTVSAMLAFLEHDKLPKDSVLVIDEAGMVGTRALATLTHHASRSHAKVVLVGDHRQLPEIDAGGAFGHLARHPNAIHLVDNRRQRDRAERHALVEWRTGRIAEAIGRLRGRGNIIEADNADLLRARLVADWKHAVDAGEAALMLARRRTDVSDLNQRARAELKDTGWLDASSERSLAGLALCEGEWVIARRNDRRIGVHNGDLGVVTYVDERQATVALDRGGTVAIPVEYVMRGHLDHGYALTVHKAQGATCDRTFVLGDDSLHNEIGYTAMSRGRTRNQLYVMRPDRDDPGGHGAVEKVEFDLVAAIRRSEAQQLATELLPQRGRSVGIER